MPTIRLLVALTVAVSLALTACSSEESASPDAKPTVVVTHSILGDVIEQTAGEQVEVITIMGPGTDPHDFGASARDVDMIQRADVLIVNGGGFEEGLLDILESATSDGVSTFEALSAVRVLEVEEAGNTKADPHFFTDPTRTAEAVDGVVDFLIEEIDTIDGDALRASAEDYLAELDALDRDLVAMFSQLDEAERVLVTNHEVFAYLADRYGFAVIGTVVPGTSTDAAASAADLADLAATIEAAGVPAIFVERSASDELAQVVANEVGPVAVVPLFSESLGDEDSGGATYLELMRTNAERITAALGSEAP
jgi:zinc/manganese transport system substrate-binding protein